MTSLTTIDFPSLTRFAIGFDRIFDELARVEHNMAKTNYPPYNIVRLSDTEFEIQMAVAGFSPDELEVETREGHLTVTGKKKEGAQGEYLYRGISNRNFVRTLALAENIEVRGATVSDGMLYIHLERIIPEAMRPRKIEIKTSVSARTLDVKPDESLVE